MWDNKVSLYENHGLDERDLQTAGQLCAKHYSAIVRRLKEMPWVNERTNERGTAVANATTAIVHAGSRFATAPVSRYRRAESRKLRTRIYVPALLSDLYGSRVLAEKGRVGGKRSSPAKTAAVREMGAKVAAPARKVWTRLSPNCMQ